MCNTQQFIYMISYALIALTHYPESVPNIVINSTWTCLGKGARAKDLYPSHGVTCKHRSAHSLNPGVSDCRVLFLLRGLGFWRTPWRHAKRFTLALPQLATNNIQYLPLLPTQNRARGKKSTCHTTGRAKLWIRDRRVSWRRKTV